MMCYCIRFIGISSLIVNVLIKNLEFIHEIRKSLIKFYFTVFY